MPTAARSLTLPLLAVAVCGGLLMGYSPATQADGGASVAFAPSSRIWMEGDSTLHRYKSTATRFELSATTQAGAAGFDLAGLELVIPVKGMKSHDKQLDANMYRALEADQHPTIRFVLRDAKVTEKNGALSVTADGMLTVAGAEKPVSVTASGARSGSSFRLSGRKELKMTQFGVKPPVILGGVIRTSDEITVYYELAGTIKE